MEAVTRKKKLIEVALPLDDINRACIREKSIRHGHPSTLHLWWARRPLAAARAVIFAQMVDDPSEHPELFPTEDEQERERQRLFDIIRQLVQWENTTNQAVLETAHTELMKSWRMTCAENKGYPRSEELFDPENLPAFYDPFAGGGSLPLEAQRLGLDAFASDLNPVAVLINKALIEIPARFAGKAPVNPAARRETDLLSRSWRGALGLAEDVRFYGQWMRDEALKRLSQFYPTIEVTAEMARERPELGPLRGSRLTVIAWLWARTVASPNPAFSEVHVPLVATFMLSTKAGKEIYVAPVVDGCDYRFTVRSGEPLDPGSALNGTKLSRGANFRCLLSGTPIDGEYIKAEGKAGRLGVRLMAIVAEGERGRVYLSPTEEQEAIACQARPEWRPDYQISGSTQYLGVKPYGMNEFSQLFSERQLLTLSTLASLVVEAHERVRMDALTAGLRDDRRSLDAGGTGAYAYADAVSIYLGLGVSKLSDYNSTLVQWSKSRDQAVHVFGRQALPMVWDFAEVNPFADAAGDLCVSIAGICRVIESWLPGGDGFAAQADAQEQEIASGKVISTDPPYYDNVPYSDLSDYFYVWLRQALKTVVPHLFETLSTPKANELVAFAYRHSSKVAAGSFFLNGMKQALHRLSQSAHPAFPVTIYYAFKQSEDSGDGGTASTGWETFLEALIQSDFEILGTWPMRTEKTGRMRENDSNALASSIVLVCRSRLADTPVATRREFLNVLKAELPMALAHLQRENIAPVDLAQAAIGPGMAVFTRYAKVMEADGRQLTIRAALSLINEALDEVLAQQEGNFDADSRFAIAWFEHVGFEPGEFGRADVLARAKNTSVSGLVEARIIRSRGGMVSVLRPGELNPDWDPGRDSRISAWEIVNHLVRALESDGEDAAAELVSKLGSQAEVGRELAYRLYTIAERHKWAQEALSYNGLVQSWPEIVRLSRETGAARPTQTDLLGAL